MASTTTINNGGICPATSRRSGADANGSSQSQQQQFNQNGDGGHLLLGGGTMPTGTTAAAVANDYALVAVRNDAEMKMLAEYAVDYAHSIGLICRSGEEKYKYANDVSVAPPFALLPSPFPHELYKQAIGVQPALNELYFRIACDHDFLMEAYKDVIKGDPFHAKLIELAKVIQKEGIKQPLMVQLQRADYLSHLNDAEQKMELKQVEVNPGQIGGPGAATAMSKLHRKMLEKLEIVHGQKLPVLAKAAMPHNRPGPEIAQTIYQAWKMFGDPNAIILYVNQPDLFPVCHFEQLQFIMFHVEKLAKQDGARVLIRRLSFKQLRGRLSLDESGDYSLYLDGTKRIALVHMAYGYLPEHYPENDFDLRAMMERSSAILSPNLRLQLAGTKKIQQLLSKPGVLEHFFPNEPQKVASLRGTYTNLWGLEENDATTMAIIVDAMKRCHDYVMKSQMDGGHGIYFNEDIPKMLSQLSLEERSAFILMKKIKPVVAKNFMVRPFEAPHREEINCEMGIFGSMIGDQKTGKVLLNAVNGHLVRSKAASQNHGGVSCGGGVLDSLLLFPSNEFH